MAETAFHGITAPVVRWITILTAVLALSSPAHAQEDACGPRASWVDFLTQNLHQTPTGHGLTAMQREGGPAVVELWTGADGSWSLLTSYPEGLACLSGAGREWTAEAGEPV